MSAAGRTASYIGSWHPSYCGSLVACASLGGGWFAATQGANRYLAYWTSWNWGPAYQLYTYPLYATRTVLDHWEPYWEAYVALVDVWSDPEQAVAWNTGFDVYEEPGDYDPTDGPDIQLIAGAFDGYSGAGKMRGCTVVTGHGKIDVPGMFDVAHPQFRTRFCWSKYKKKASYAAGSMSFDPGVARGYEICCGADITVRDAHVEYYGWNGGDQGVARMARDFDLTFAPTGPLKIGKYTYQRYVYAIRGYWNGAYEGVLRVR